MKKTASVLLALVLVAAIATGAMANVTISQVYGGGGGGTTNTYRYDYVELLNVSGTTVDIGGWILAYSASSGSFNTGNLYTIPSPTTIGPCHYFLIRCGTPGTGTELPVTPDLITPITVLSLSATNGKVALVSNGTVGTGICPGTQGNGTGTVVDFLGYGGVNCAEGTPTAAMTGAKSAVRNNGGVTDTNNNVSDFTIVTAPGFAPRNSSSTSQECIQTPAIITTWGNVKALYR